MVFLIEEPGRDLKLLESIMKSITDLHENRQEMESPQAVP